MTVIFSSDAGRQTGSGTVDRLAMEYQKKYGQQLTQPQIQAILAASRSAEYGGTAIDMSGFESDLPYGSEERRQASSDYMNKLLDERRQKSLNLSLDSLGINPNSPPTYRPQTPQNPSSPFDKLRDMFNRGIFDNARRSPPIGGPAPYQGPQDQRVMMGTLGGGGGERNPLGTAGPGGDLQRFQGIQNQIQNMFSGGIFGGREPILRYEAGPARPPLKRNPFNGGVFEGNQFQEAGANSLHRQLGGLRNQMRQQFEQTQGPETTNFVEMNGEEFRVTNPIPVSPRPSQGRVPPPSPYERNFTMDGDMGMKQTDFDNRNRQRLQGGYNRGINPGGMYTGGQGGGFGSPFGGSMRGRQQPMPRPQPQYGGGYGGGMMPPPYGGGMGGGYGGGFGMPSPPNMGYGNRFAGMQFSGPFAQPMMPQNYGMGGGFGGGYPMPQPRYPMPQPRMPYPMMGGGMGGGYGGGYGGGMGGGYGGGFGDMIQMFGGY